MALRELARIKSRVSRLEAGHLYYKDKKPRMFVESEDDAYNILRVTVTDEVEIALASVGVSKPLGAPMTVLVLIGHED